MAVFLAETWPLGSSIRIFGATLLLADYSARLLYARSDGDAREAV